jgi:gamma-glutamyl-gamma-aminobutyrate hydrolase PuuD
MARFAYTASESALSLLMPRLPLIFSHNNHSIAVDGLVDTGSTINVLPYNYGVATNRESDEPNCRPDEISYPLR